MSLHLFGLLSSLLSGSSLGFLGTSLLGKCSSTLAAVVPIFVLSHESAWTTVVTFELVFVYLSALVNLVVFQGGELDLLMLM